MPNTIIFLKKWLINWSKLEKYFPIVVVTEDPYVTNKDKNNLTVIKVKDLEMAFWKFIHFYRNQFQIPIVTVTGTSGKTTTKEMIKHILSLKLNVQATVASNNSRTQHLHYLLGIDDSTQAAVFETPIGHPGDILNANKYYQPTMGVITNIGSHHLNTCKTKEGYIKAKGELIHSLRNDGLLFLNSDDKNTKTLDLTNFSGKIITFGLSENAQFQASNIRYLDNGMEYILSVKNTKYTVFVPGFGKHQVYNSLVALAVADKIGIPLPEAINQLATFKNLCRHLELCKGMNGATILDDTWNMTSTSIESAMEVLNDIANGRAKILVMGSMTDLGAWGFRMHEEVGKIICNHGVDTLITIGYLAGKTGSYVLEHGTDCKVHTFDDQGHFLAYFLLKETADENSLILLKGDMLSKGMKMLAAKLKGKRI
jgi:UDP-N-acetylmuramoyl-tripeptide--D-alanyl-D-alanine ligase